MSGLTQPITNVTVSCLPDPHLRRRSHHQSRRAGWDDSSTCRARTARAATITAARARRSRRGRRSTIRRRTPLRAGTAPFVGSFRPEAAARDVQRQVGGAANGTWKLRINDTAPAIPARCMCWSLNINQARFRWPTTSTATARRISVFRPTTGQWFINGLGRRSLRPAGDIPVPGDYDGDGIARRRGVSPVDRHLVRQRRRRRDPVRPRPATSPVPADYDGDERTESRRSFAPPTASSASGC